MNNPLKFHPDGEEEVDMPKPNKIKLNLICWIFQRHFYKVIQYRQDYDEICKICGKIKVKGSIK